MKIRKIILGLALFVIVMFCIGLFISRPVVKYGYAGSHCIVCVYDPIGERWHCESEEEPGGTFCQALEDYCEVRGQCTPS